MRTIEELRQNGLERDSSLTSLGRLKYLLDKKVDFDVFLPSRNMNLQRDFVWTLEQKREIIMSILLGRDIPPVSVLSIVDRKDKQNPHDIYQIIDGKQRLSAMLSFLKGEFSIVVDDVEMYHDDLPKDYRLEVDHYSPLAKMVYEPWERRVTDEEKIAWFKLINFAGTPQDVEHMQKLS